jgi:hypothetical protein
MQTLTYREVLSFLFVPLLYLLFIISLVSVFHSTCNNCQLCFLFGVDNEHFVISTILKYPFMLHLFHIFSYTGRKLAKIIHPPPPRT